MSRSLFYLILAIIGIALVSTKVFGVGGGKGFIGIFMDKIDSDQRSRGSVEPGGVRAKADEDAQRMREVRSRQDDRVRKMQDDQEAQRVRNEQMRERMNRSMEKLKGY